MDKETLENLVTEYGDAVITYRSLNSRKLKYNVCTLEFDCEYVKTKRNKAKEDESTVLMFCWDSDSFRLIKPRLVTSVVPLASVLKNVK